MWATKTNARGGEEGHGEDVIKRVGECGGNEKENERMERNGTERGKKEEEKKTRKSNHETRKNDRREIQSPNVPFQEPGTIYRNGTFWSHSCAPEKNKMNKNNSKKKASTYAEARECRERCGEGARVLGEEGQRKPKHKAD